MIGSNENKNQLRFQLVSSFSINLMIKINYSLCASITYFC